MERDLRRRAAIVLLLVLAVGVVAATGHFVPITQNSDGVVLNQPGGPTATLTGNFDAYRESGGVDSSTIQWNTSAGNASFSSSGSTQATLSTNDLSGTWTNLSSLDVTGAELTINPANKRKISVEGDADKLRFRDATLDDGNPDFVVGAPSGSSTVTVRGLPASTTISAVNKSSGKPLDVTSSDGSGTVSFSIEHSTQTVLLQQGDQTNQPTFSNADPTTNLSNAPTQLSIDIKDGDMPEDTLDAEFFMKSPGAGSFSSVGTQSLSSNGTATASITATTAGEYEWYVEVSDNVGSNTVTSSTFTFGVPDELQIYNETSPSSLITSPTEGTVQFFAENGSVYERSTTNGKIDFSGLPADQDFVVTASTPDYHDRTIYIESLIKQQRIYLLNDSAFQTANIIFSLDDRTGDFTPGDESTLFVEKALTISGNTKYQVIVSDQFSATNEIPVTLQNNQRYRLRLEGPDGDTRILGAYRTSGNDAATLTVGSVTFEGEDPTSPVFHAQLLEENGNRLIRIKYEDPANATSGLTLMVVNRTDPSDVIRPETTETGPFGTYVETIPISNSKEQISYNVTWSASRTGFENTGGYEFIGDIPKIAKDLGLDPNILSMLGFLTILGTLALTAIAYPRYSGIPTTAVAIGLVALGVLSIHPLLLGGAGVISLIFAVGGGS